MLSSAAERLARGLEGGHERHSMFKRAVAREGLQTTTHQRRGRPQWGVRSRAGAGVAGEEVVPLGMALLDDLQLKAAERVVVALAVDDGHVNAEEAHERVRLILRTGRLPSGRPGQAFSDGPLEHS